MSALPLAELLSAAVALAVGALLTAIFIRPELHELADL
jgi:hypothetical protein